MTDTETRVKKLLVEHLGCDADKVTDEAMLADDLGADSLDIIGLEMAADEEFGIEFPSNGTLKMDSTVADVVRAIDALRASA